MTTTTATPEEQVQSLIKAARRSGGTYVCGSIDQFTLLLERGEINGGIRNSRQENGLFKTQCRLQVGDTEVFFFTVYTDEPLPEK